MRRPIRLSALALFAALMATGIPGSTFTAPTSIESPTMVSSYPIKGSVFDGRGEYLQASAEGDPAMVLNESLFSGSDFEAITRDEASHALRTTVTFLDEWVADGPQWQPPAGLDRELVNTIIVGGAGALVSPGLLGGQGQDAFIGIVYDFARSHRYTDVAWSYGQPRLINRSTQIDTATQALRGETQTITFTGRLGFTHRGTSVHGGPVDVMQHHSFTIELERGRAGYLISGIQLTALV